MVTRIEGVDYTNLAAGWPAGLVAAGKKFACRYGGPGGAWKQVDAAEVAALHGAGMAVVANAEGAADGLKFGAAAGRAWARSAGAFWKALGLPAGRPIYLSADFDASAGDMSTLASAFAAAEVELSTSFGYHAGAYAEYDVLEYLYGRGVVRWFWQTYAWSNGKIWRPDKLHIYQHHNGVSIAGGDCDLNTAYQEDYGQWEAQMSFMDDKDFKALAYRVEAIISGRDAVIGGPTAGEKVQTWDKIADVVVAKLASGGAITVEGAPLGEADKPVIVAAVKEAFREGSGPLS